MKRTEQDDLHLAVALEHMPEPVENDSPLLDEKEQNRLSLEIALGKKK